MHLRRINARKVSTSFSTQTVRDSTLVCGVISIHVKRKRNVWTLSGKAQRHSVANMNFHLGYHHDNWPNLLTSCGRCINYLKWPLRCDQFRCEQTRLRVWPHKATARASGLVRRSNWSWSASVTAPFERDDERDLGLLRLNCFDSSEFCLTQVNDRSICWPDDLRIRRYQWSKHWSVNGPNYSSHKSCKQDSRFSHDL